MLMRVKLFHLSTKKFMWIDFLITFVFSVKVFLIFFNQEIILIPVTNELHLCRSQSLTLICMHTNAEKYKF